MLDSSLEHIKGEKGLSSIKADAAFGGKKGEEKIKRLKEARNF